LTAARLYLNSTPELPKNWWQLNPHVSDYHPDPMEISSTFSIPDITDGLMRQAVTLSKFADLSYVACDKFSLISHCVAVEASFCLGRDVIGWRQSKTTCMTPHKKVPVRLYARANNQISVGDDPAFDTMNTENASEMN